MLWETEQKLKDAIQQVLYHNGEPMTVQEIRKTIDPFGLMEGAIARMVYHQIDERKLVWLPDLRVGLEGWPDA